LVLLFLDSMLVLVLLVGVGVGVAGWNIESGSWFFLVLLGGFGTLLGPEGTPFGVFLLAPGLDCLTRSLWVWWWSWWVGVWLCVECCIVDASILL
jgi:hypothetical protein